MKFGRKLNHICMPVGITGQRLSCRQTGVPLTTEKMGTMDQSQLLQSIEVLKAAKPLFESSHSYFVPLVGVIGAATGALCSYIPNRLLDRKRRHENTKSTAFQIYAEVKATLDIVAHRRYVETVEQIVSALRRGQLTSLTFKIIVADSLFPVYAANISNLGILPPKLVVKIVRFYQTAQAIVQDIKPGGILTEGEPGLEQFEELLDLFSVAKQLGNEIAGDVESIYPELS